MNRNKAFNASLLHAPAQESLTWIERLAPGVLQLAARNGPESLRDRLAEEWLADFARLRGDVAQLRFVFGCFWAAVVIGRENPLVAPVPATSSYASKGGAVRRHPGRSVQSPRRAYAANDSVMSEMNITPLIDVMLVLLVTLIVSLPTMTHAVKLDLPREAAVRQTSLPAVIDLDIDSDGTIAWNGTVLTGLQELESYLQAEAQTNPQAEIHLRPERRAKYDVVAKVLASAQRNRMEKMAFVNTSEFAN
jgi:biopolymer transport protein ExbD